MPGPTTLASDHPAQPDAAWYRSRFNMTRHAEGGSFAEVYRSELMLAPSALPKSYSGERPASTHIYFLLEREQFSAFHRIASDELWHFYDGDPIRIYEIRPDGSLIEHLLGHPSHPNYFTMIRAGSWFASQTTGDFSLVGCTVAPGFDFADFELATAAVLEQNHPQHVPLIRRFCR